MHDAKAVLPIVSSYAEKLLAKKSARPLPAQAAHDPDEWVRTGEAARLTGYSQRHIVTLCEQGFFIEGMEWRQRAPKAGMNNGGFIRIHRAALKRLKRGRALVKLHPDGC